MSPTQINEGQQTIIPRNQTLMADVLRKGTETPKPAQDIQNQIQSQENSPKPRKTTLTFINRLHERRETCQATKEWIGIFLTCEEVEACIGDINKSLFNHRS